MGSIQKNTKNALDENEEVSVEVQSDDQAMGIIIKLFLRYQVTSIAITNLSWAS